jgi:dolichyl-diphosphooligosaccharide---protein glycosyltransferase
MGYDFAFGIQSRTELILCDVAGGYAFITNMIPLHSLVLILMSRYTNRLYVAYSSWYAIGTLASMQVPFVGFQPVSTSEHMAALGAYDIRYVRLIR